MDALIRAFEAGALSIMKPFGSCGFELLRVLGLEFSLRTRTEAIYLRSEVMKKDYRIDTSAMAVDTSRYDKLISTLPSTVPWSDLTLNEPDQALISSGTCLLMPVSLNKAPGTARHLEVPHQ